MSGSVCLKYLPTSAARCSCGRFWLEHSKSKTAIRQHSKLCGGTIILEEEDGVSSRPVIKGSYNAMSVVRSRDNEEAAAGYTKFRTILNKESSKSQLDCLSMICANPKFDCPWIVRDGVQYINPKAWKILGQLQADMKVEKSKADEVRAEKKRAKNRERAKQKKKDAKKKKEQQRLAEALE